MRASVVAASAPGFAAAGVPQPPASASQAPNGSSLLRRRPLLHASLFPWLLLLLAPAALPPPSLALGFTKELKKRAIPLEDYATNEAGLPYYDTAAGRGREAAVGSLATIHFDCTYRGIDVVSSRQARLLGGNRTIAEPYTVRRGCTAASAAAAVGGKGIPSDSDRGRALSQPFPPFRPLFWAARSSASGRKGRRQQRRRTGIGQAACSSAGATR